MRERFEQLDALRGLAALAVLLEHFLQTLPSVGDKEKWTEGMKAAIYNPLKMFWGGHEAVIFFFVLSGFVLSLPYYKDKQLPYGIFIARRVIRIYLPYLAAIGAALFIATLVPYEAMPGLSDWFNSLGTARIDAGLLLNHLFLIGGSYDYKAFDSVIWTLIHEMRIALLFPLIMLAVLRMKPAVLLLGCMLLSLIGFFANNMLLDPEYAFIYYWITLHYVSMFVIGALAAKHRVALIARFRALRTRTKAALLAGGLLMYSYSYWFLPGMEALHKRIIDDWVISAGVVVIMVVSLASAKAERVLAFKPIAFLGRISYSLYLFHFLALILCVRLLSGHVPLALIWLIAFALTLVVSQLSYRFVELPSIRLGKRFVARSRGEKVPGQTV